MQMTSPAAKLVTLATFSTFWPEFESAFTVVDWPVDVLPASGIGAPGWIPPAPPLLSTCRICAWIAEAGAVAPFLPKRRKSIAPNLVRRSSVPRVLFPAASVAAAITLTLSVQTGVAVAMSYPPEKRCWVLGIRCWVLGSAACFVMRENWHIRHPSSVIRPCPIPNTQHLTPSLNRAGERVPHRVHVVLDCGIGAGGGESRVVGADRHGEER